MRCDPEFLRRHRAAVCRWMGWDENVETQVVTAENLSPEYPLLVYRLGESTVVAIEPEIAPAAEALLALPARSAFGDYFGALFQGVGFAADDAAFWALQPDQFRKKDVPAGYRAARLGAVDERLVGYLLEALPLRERMAAEVRASDPIAFGLSFEGELACVATALAEDGLADIAVATHPYHRGLGLGGAAVSLVCQEALRQGLIPQYRAETGNEASSRLAEALGFCLSVGQFGGVAEYPGEPIGGEG